MDLIWIMQNYFFKYIENKGIYKDITIKSRIIKELVLNTDLAFKLSVTIHMSKSIIHVSENGHRLLIKGIKPGHTFIITP